VLGLGDDLAIQGVCEIYRRQNHNSYIDLCDLQNNASACKPQCFPNGKHRVTETSCVDAKEYGFGSKKTDKSTFMDFPVYDTTLNIEQFGLQGLWLWGNETDTKQITWLNSANQTFNQEYIEKSGKCTPLSVRLILSFHLRFSL
jgi:hypothetical protein